MNIIDKIKSIFHKKQNLIPIIPDYDLLWRRCQVDPDKVGVVNEIVSKYWVPNRLRYEKVSVKTGVPSWVVFCIHWKEASCSFSGALHNGDRVIGNGKYTYNVPKGRGLFATWEATAVDALLLEKNKFPMYWSNILTALEFCEKYNGLGHRKHGELSPYVWAYTNNSDETGNYVSDGKYNPLAPIKSAGVASLLLGIMALDKLVISNDRKYIL
jgi:lysozyme family protein